MSMFSDLYESINQFQSAGGHVRRRILLNVKREHEQQKQHCDDCRILLMNCTNIHSSEWSILLDNLTAAHFKLGEILNELKRLEYTHIESGGHLPYPSISM